ncbi:hypothetical protein GCM10025867_01630 [Frondihabitans sucicola]|uniref:Extracellular solute-binding protein n=1 Tax=Frondihabitans sucicola TaxID=1268041 RepID=A0ABN6XSC4_9MICO|nr:hypothetical protein [Frondihabitans sucicola]BDZ47922.1 hypothetical protein GCM10025867_01630 [Frondihabitans sucicola]
MVNPAYPGLIDIPNQVIRYWGTGDEKIDMTTVPDTATFTARVAADPDAAPGVHTVSGALVSFNDIAREIEAVSGVKLRHESWGNLDDLNRAIEAKGGSWNAVMEWYFFAMLQTPRWRTSKTSATPTSDPPPSTTTSSPPSTVSTTERPMKSTGRPERVVCDGVLSRSVAREGVPLGGGRDACGDGAAEHGDHDRLSHVADLACFLHHSRGEEGRRASECESPSARLPTRRRPRRGMQ